MKIMYRTVLHGDFIEKIEANRVTEKSIWLNGFRKPKRSENINYWETLKEAKAYLENSYLQEIKIAEIEIDYYRSKIVELKKQNNNE